MDIHFSHKSTRTNATFALTNALFALFFYVILAPSSINRDRRNWQIF